MPHLVGSGVAATAAAAAPNSQAAAPADGRCTDCSVGSEPPVCAARGVYVRLRRCWRAGRRACAPTRSGCSFAMLLNMFASGSAHLQGCARQREREPRRPGAVQLFCRLLSRDKSDIDLVEQARPIEMHAALSGGAALGALLPLLVGDPLGKHLVVRVAPHSALLHFSLLHSAICARNRESCSSCSVT